MYSEELRYEYIIHTNELANNTNNDNDKRFNCDSLTLYSCNYLLSFPFLISVYCTALHSNELPVLLHFAFASVLYTNSLRVSQ